MAPFVSYLRTLGIVPTMDQRKTVPLSFCDVLMQVQHKGSCYLEISEPESEGFESDEWEEDEQQIHNQGPSNCPPVINRGNEKENLSTWRKSFIVKVLDKTVGKLSMSKL